MSNCWFVFIFSTVFFSLLSRSNLLINLCKFRHFYLRKKKTIIFNLKREREKKIEMCDFCVLFWIACGSYHITSHIFFSRIYVFQSTQIYLISSIKWLELSEEEEKNNNKKYNKPKSGCQNAEMAMNFCLFLYINQPIYLLRLKAI